LQKTIIEQVHPDLVWWRSVLINLNLNIENTFGDFQSNEYKPNLSTILVLALKKADNKNNPNYTENVAEKAYDSVASKYDLTTKSVNYGIPAWLNTKIQKYSKYSPIILDMGCASGNLAELLVASSVSPCKLYGADISSSMLEVARRKNIYDALIKWDLNQGFNEPSTLYFDLILAIGFSEFLKEPAAFLTDTRRLLQIGGELLMSFESDVHGKKTTLIELPFGRLIRKAYSKLAVEQLMHDAGFALESLEHIDAYVSPTTEEHVSYWVCQARKKGL